MLLFAGYLVFRYSWEMRLLINQLGFSIFYIGSETAIGLSGNLIRNTALIFFLGKKKNNI